MNDDPVPRLRAWLGRGVSEELPPTEFDQLALDVLRFQLARNETYRRFAAARGVDPSSLSHWTEAPMVPTRAFKTARLATGDPTTAEAVFRTSGTSLGRDRRGEHYVQDLSLYEASLIPTFRSYVLPDDARLPVVALVGNPTRVRDSSLSFMVGAVERELCASGGGYFFDHDRGLDVPALNESVRALTAAGRPVLVVGTAFALLHWTDTLAKDSRCHDLVEGSRVVETGGFKGRSRMVGRPELYHAIENRLGVPRYRIVNEYGMTELLSQFYETVLVEPPDENGDDLTQRLLKPPPWVRTRILDPETLEPLAGGSVGLLHHLDLANVHSVSSVLTEDLGVAAEGGFRVLGRAADGEPRGCSLTMEDFLAATADLR